MPKPEGIEVTEYEPKREARPVRELSPELRAQLSLRMQESYDAGYEDGRADSDMEWPVRIGWLLMGALGASIFAAVLHLL